MKDRKVAIIVSLFIGIISISSLSLARTWTGKNGSTIEAEFVSANGDQVDLKKENGKSVTVHIDKLSVQDQEYIQKRISETEEKSTEQSQYFALKLEFSTEAQNASISILPPWDSKVLIKGTACPELTEENARRKEKGLPPYIPARFDDLSVKRREQSGLEDKGEYYPEIIMEYLLYVEASESDDFKFTIDKTPWGPVRLKISAYDPKTGKEKGISSFNNTTNQEKEFTLEISKIQHRCKLFEYATTSR